MVCFAVGQYLVKRHYGGERRSLGGRTGSAQAVVFIETRDDFFGPLAMRAALHWHPGWDAVVVGTEDVLERFDEREVTHKVAIASLSGPRDFSELLFTERFWSEFERYEHILIVQTDTVVVRPVRAPHLRFDFIGPVCGNLDPDNFVINGGLSLRKPASFLRALQLFTDKDFALPEDVAFTRVMRRHSFALPAIGECNSFAIESIGHPAAAVGMHGTDKYYAPSRLVEELLASVD